MKFIRVFLLCCLSPLIFLTVSCSSDTPGDSTIDLIPDTDADVVENMIKVEVNREVFEPDRLVVNTEASIINIVGTQTSSNRSVFLTFKANGTGVLKLGNASNNPDGNVAGFLMNAENRGFLTNAIEGEWGEIRITKYDPVGKKISGEFYFTAYDINYRPIVLENGSFTDVSF